MRNAENDPTKKRLTLTDIFFLVAVALLLAAIVAQDLAVYMINKNDSSERFYIDFVISLSSEKAEELKKQTPQNEAVTVWLDDVELGKLEGGFTDAGSVDGYVKLSGTMRAAGTQNGEEYRIYRFDRNFKVGDKLYVIFEGTGNTFAPTGYTIEITSVTNITSVDASTAGTA